MLKSNHAKKKYQYNSLKIDFCKTSFFGMKLRKKNYKSKKETRHEDIINYYTSILMKD